MSANDQSRLPQREVEGSAEYQNQPNQQIPHRSSHSTTSQVPSSNGQTPAHVNGGLPVSPAAPTMFLPAQQPLNDAVTSAVHTTDSSISPELIQLITQNVIQQMQAHKLSSSAAPPVMPPTSAPADQIDNASSFSGSPTFGRPQVYTPPSPHHPTEPFPNVQPVSPMAPTSRVNAHGYETSIRREASPFSHGSGDEAVSNPVESKILRPEPIRRASTDNDATLLEKIWGKLFDEQGESTPKLQAFLRGIAVHLIEDYEPKHSLVITPDKMQRYYAEMGLGDQPEIYPWQHIFDDKTSSISRLLREPEVRVEHHLIQNSLSARPEIPGLTPNGFAAWLTLLIRAHPDHEFERLAKTAREMPISDPDHRQERFPKELPRRLFPTTGDDRLATTLAELMSAHCKVQVRLRQTSTTESDSRQSQASPPLTSRKPESYAATVEDVVDESEQPETVPLHPSLTNRTSTSTVDSSGSRLRETVSRSSVSTAPSEPPVELEDSDAPTPRPIERERKPYVGQTGGGKSYDVAVSSGDEKSDGKSSSAFQNDLRRTKSISTSQPRARPPPPIALHQRNSTVQADMMETARSRSTTTGGDQGTSIHRTRSNSSYAGDVQPHRRTRSNSTYANDSGGTRYHSKRSPSLSKTGFDIPRSSAPDMKSPGYPPPYPYPSSHSGNNGSSQSGHDYRSQNYDPRELRNRERERDREKSRDRDHDIRASRPRMQSMAAGVPPDLHNYGDEYHRQQGDRDRDRDRQQSTYVTGTNGNYVQPAGGPYQYPPTAYRDRDRESGRP